MADTVLQLLRPGALDERCGQPDPRDLDDADDGVPRRQMTRDTTVLGMSTMVVPVRLDLALLVLPRRPVGPQLGVDDPADDQNARAGQGSGEGEETTTGESVEPRVPHEPTFQNVA